MTDPWLDAGGTEINPNSVAAKISADNQAAIDAKMSEWFGHTTELAAFDADAVLELRHHVV